MQESAALDAVEMLYQASLEQQLWPEALERFAHAVGCVGMAMIPITPNDTTGLIVSPSMREVETDYKRTWWRHDTRVARIFERRLSRGVFCEPQLFEEQELARDPFRQEFCRNHGIGVFAAQLLEPLPGHVLAFSGQREIKRGHFEQADIERLSWLGRHAARALTISLKLAAGEGIANGLLSVLDRFEGGVFVLNARREVALMNARAKRLLGDGLSVQAGELRTPGTERQRAIDRLIAAALRRPPRPAAPIALPRPGAGRPLIVQAIPLPSQHALGGLVDPTFGRSGVLVLVIDPGVSAQIAHECLRLFGLTAAEARLAALVGSGMRRRSAAALLGISEWTARDSLKTVYSKLDINSSAELVRLVESVAAIVRHSPSET